MARPQCTMKWTPRTPWVVILLAVLALPAIAHAGKKVYCTPHHHPKGCIKVPASAIRPHGVSQQGAGPTRQGSTYENGGGYGGGGGPRSTAERNRAEAYGTSGIYDSARQLMSSAILHHDPIARAPRGTLVFFAPDQFNNAWGHVGISLGDGRMVSALDSVRITNVQRARYWRAGYVGWADAPGTLPGRVPPDTTPPPGSDIAITGPAANQTLSGVQTIYVTSQSATAVSVRAYYATNPRDATTRGWHNLEAAQRAGDMWTFDWDTTSIPDQGEPTWGTVRLEAIAVDANGRPTANRDARRFEIDNAAATATAPPSASVTYEETTGGAAHSWTNYTNAGGTEGATIPAFTPVDIRCKVTGFRVADGNTWWYRIASSPWSDSYYVSADAFYNNGHTSGSLQGTPFVDPAVPDCDSASSSQASGGTPSGGGTTTGTPSSTTTYTETAGGTANTWTDYTTAGGTQGPTVPVNQPIQITCAVEGFRVQDGNTWWYRIASSPWSDGYYASADAFYNNGQTSGSLQNTPYVDPAVPHC
jgi:hypothetical protein